MKSHTYMYIPHDPPVCSLELQQEIAADAPGGATTTKGSIPVAEVLQTLAINLYYNCEYVAAKAAFARAVRMRVDVMPAGHAEVGRCICAQSLNHAAMGNLLEAKALAEKGHAILAKAYGTKKVETGEGFMARVRVLMALGKYVEYG